MATGTNKGTYTARDLSDAELENLIRIDSTNYHDTYRIRRVYVPATLRIRDLLLTINKTVTGDFADTSKPFTFTLESIQGMSSGTFNATIIRAFEGTTTETTISIGGTFWMRDHDTVMIEGLPKGKEVVFHENNDIYRTTWQLNGNDAIMGSDRTIILSDDSNLEVINRLDPPAPTGYHKSMTPYLILLLTGAIMGVVLCAGKRKRAEKAGRQ